MPPEEQATGKPVGHFLSGQNRVQPIMDDDAPGLVVLGSIRK